MKPADRPRWLLAGVICFVVVTVIICHERYLAGGDPANLALAVKYGMDLGQERLHAPGYPFFVLAWRFVSSATGMSTHETMLTLNLILAVASIVVLWKLVRKLFDERTAALACATMALNPLFLYFACISETYIFDALFSVGAFLLIFRASEKRSLVGWFMIGLLGGFRISSVVLMTPVLLIVQQIEHGRNDILKRAARSLAALLLGVAVWGIPFLLTVPLGDSIHELFASTALHRTSFLQSEATCLTYLFWTFNLWIVLLVWKARQFRQVIKGPLGVALVVWIAIPLTFFFFVYYAKGYALLIWPSMAILLARISLDSNKVVWRLFPALAIAFSISIFFLTPFVEPRTNLQTSDQRPFLQRIRALEARSLSHFLLALSKIRKADQDFADCTNLIRRVGASQRLLFIDGSANTWIFPKALMLAFPSDTFITVNAAGNGTVKFYHSASTIDKYPTDSLDVTNAFLLWQDTRTLQSVGKEVGAQLARVSYFGIYEFSDPKAFLKAISFHAQAPPSSRPQ